MAPAYANALEVHAQKFGLSHDHLVALLEPLVQVCLEDMCIEMCMEICMVMCIDKCIDMCIEMVEQTFFGYSVLMNLHNFQVHSEGLGSAFPPLNV